MSQEPSTGPDRAGGAAGSSDPARLRAALRHWFLRPPRLHGEVDAERSVSFLELLYDLVFVVLIGQTAHHLAEHPSAGAFGVFVVVFSLIWIAWLNGSLHHEGHGRADGRGRNNIFGQMTILVVLAVFVGEAGAADGRPFAVTYAVLLCWIAYQWGQVRHHDVVPMYRQVAARYIAMLVLSIVLMGVSAFVDDRVRIALWALTVLLNALVPIVGMWLDASRPLGLMPTESMAERFSLLAIIVMGEVVVGVVNGINSTDRGALVLVTAVLSLGTGFGFWWNYFDLLGRRPPRPTQAAFAPWVLLHLPLTGAIAATGAGMVGAIQHALDEHTPAGPGWLLAGSSATLLVVIALLTTRLDYRDHFVAILPRVQRTMVVGALACIGVGLWLPAPWLLTLLLAVVHQGVWWSTFVQLARHTDVFVPAQHDADRPPQA